MFKNLLKKLGIDTDAVDSVYVSDDEEDDDIVTADMLWSAGRYNERDADGASGALFGHARDDGDDDTDEGRDTSSARKAKARDGHDGSGDSDSDAFLEEGVLMGDDDEDSDLFSSGSAEEDEDREYDEYDSASEEDDYSGDSEEFDVYARDKPYEFSHIEHGLFLLREAGSTLKFVLLAHESHPLVSFTRNLRAHEKSTLRSMLARAPDDLETLRDGRVPGVLTHFVVEKLYRAPKFVVPTRDGTTAELDSMPQDSVVPERPETLDVEQSEPEDSAELFLLDPEDEEYDVKYQALIDITAGKVSPAVFDRFEKTHNRGNLSRFRATGHTGAGFSATSEEFETVSPVSELPGPWYCVKMHYYAMYKSFMNLRDCTQSTLLDLVQRRQAAEEAGETRYCYDKPDPAEKNWYSAEQERSVLDRVIETAKQTEQTDNVVAVKREELMQTVGQIARSLPALRKAAEREKAHGKPVLPIYAADASDTAADLCRLVEELQNSIAALNAVTQQRFSN